MSKKTNLLIVGSTSLLLFVSTIIAGNTVDQQVETVPLRSKAQALGFLVGTAVRFAALTNDTTYGEILANEYNVITAEGEMKFRAIHPTRSEFDFSQADTIVSFATAHAMRVRGHTLIWHYSTPRWLIEGNFSKDEVSTILKQHIHTVVSRYRGRVYAWDVINEAINDDGTGLRETFWSKMLGEDYIAQALTWAREADPDAKMFYNDYGGEGLGNKSDAIYEMLKSLKGRGLPINGIGLQSHFSVEAPPKMSDVTANMKRLAALGLEIQVTEFDVQMPLPATEQKLQDQAQIYGSYLSTCLSIANCKAFVSWGFTDRYSWIPGYFTGKGAALPFDETYRAKPAYRALVQALDNSPRR
jgi:endo-1,4-beta-xylanase